MGETLMLPLRPSSTKGDFEDTLLARILQINEQRGSFRNLSEATLSEEITVKPTVDDDEIQDAELDGPEDETDTRQDSKQTDPYKGREDILRMVNVARNEAYSALDFVSLLLTKHNSRQAETSMSPFLTERIPLGTIEATKTRSTGPSAAEKRRVELVSGGWKLESLCSSAERLTDASSRLQKEAIMESKYWEQISRIKAQGWAVSTIPSEPHTLGVRFGFPEATPTFRGRGFAALRSKENGSLYLDRGSSSKHRAVRVSILENGLEVGTSSFPADYSLDSEAIEDELLQARNSLFEEELMHEAIREARASANLGFVTGHNAVTFDLREGKQIQVRLVKLTQIPWNPPVDWPANATAEMIALSLRLLLCHAHRKNFERRTRPPPPMTIKPRSVPEYSLLRPVLALLQHRDTVQEFGNWVDGQMKCLQVAGLAASIQLSPFCDIQSPLLGGDDAPQITSVSWLETLIGPLESSATIQLPSGQKLEVKMRSLLGPPIFGTEITISEVSWHSIRLPRSRHTTLAECKSSLSQIFLQDINVTIETMSVSAVPTDAEPVESSVLRWVPERPFSNNFTVRVGPSPSKSQLQVQIAPSGLLLRYVLVNRDNQPQKPHTYAWTQNGQVKKEVNGIRDDLPAATLQHIVENSLLLLKELI